MHFLPTQQKQRDLGIAVLQRQRDLGIAVLQRQRDLGTAVLQQAVIAILQRQRAIYGHCGDAAAGNCGAAL